MSAVAYGWWRLSVCAGLGFLSLQAAAQAVPEMLYEGHPLRFSDGEQPYYLDGCVMAPLRPVCNRIGVEVKRSKDGNHWSLIRGRDRVEYSIGEYWFAFNGARRELRQRPEQRGSALFVPYEILQEISDGELELSAEDGSNRSTDILYRDHLLRFKKPETPFWIGGTEYVSARAIAAVIGAKLERSKDGNRLTIIRSRDKLVYDQGQRWYMFNGAQRTLRRESIAHGKVVFVPIELFQALVGDELHSR